MYTKSLGWCEIDFNFEGGDGLISHLGDKKKLVDENGNRWRCVKTMRNFCKRKRTGREGERLGATNGKWGFRFYATQMNSFPLLCFSLPLENRHGIGPSNKLAPGLERTCVRPNDYPDPLLRPSPPTLFTWKFRSQTFMASVAKEKREEEWW